MFIRRTSDFEDALKRLPKGIQAIFRKQEKIFIDNWLDPRLHAKRVKELPGAFSMRITRRYRVLFYFGDDTAVFFAVGHRKDIYE